jgi:hypothetical protein
LALAMVTVRTFVFTASQITNLRVGRLKRIKSSVFAQRRSMRWQTSANNKNKSNNVKR